MQETTPNRVHKEDTFTALEAGSTVIPVIEEYVTIGKEIVETGTVQISKRITEEEATVNLPIIQESYHVERRPGSKDLLKEHPAVRHDGDNMIIPVVREVLIVEKRYEVTEEIHVTKVNTVVPHMQQVTLRKESVKVTRTENHT